MKMFKKFVLCLFASAVISCPTYAEVIELDPLTADHCRQQILNSNDQLPVIATYSSGGLGSEEFLEKFEALAQAHPDRTFFKWDADKDVLHITQNLCLEQLGFFIQPNIMLLFVMKDQENFAISTPLRLQFAIGMTLVDMNKFIDFSDVGNVKSRLSKKITK